MRARPLCWGWGGKARREARGKPVREGEAAGEVVVGVGVRTGEGDEEREGGRATGGETGVVSKRKTKLVVEEEMRESWTAQEVDGERAEDRR